MTTVEWDIHGPGVSGIVWTPSEVAQIARAAQAFQAALPNPSGRLLHLVALHGISVIDGDTKIDWPQPGEGVLVNPLTDEADDDPPPLMTVKQ